MVCHLTVLVTHGGAPGAPGAPVRWTNQGSSSRMVTSTTITDHTFVYMCVHVPVSSSSSGRDPTDSTVSSSRGSSSSRGDGGLVSPVRPSKLVLVTACWDVRLVLRRNSSRPG